MTTDFRNYYSVDDKPNEGVAVLPNGTYTVKIVSSEWKETKNRDGKYLQLNLAVTDGEHAGNIIVARLNLDNPNKQAVVIARGELAGIREATGVREPKNPEELHNIRFQVMLKCAKRKDDPTKDENRITRYMKKDENAAAPRQNTGNPPYARNAPQQPTIGMTPDQVAASDQVPF
jgi:Protein of unknown function (DUF669).